MEPFDEYYAAHGFDAVFSMVQLFGGMTLYIPQMRTIFQQPLELCAKNDWINHSYTFFDLARKYGWTERHWRRVMFGA